MNRDNKRFKWVFILFVIGLFITILTRYGNQPLLEKVNREILSANIKIVTLNHLEASTSVSTGASGATIGKEHNKYYALTAFHVLDDFYEGENTELLVMGKEDKDFSEYVREGGSSQGSVAYYEAFPSLQIEYVDEALDLALVSFISEEHYTVLKIAGQEASFLEKVITISNPYGKRNVITVGRVTRWIKEDNTMEHTANLSEGSSGSALLNEKLELVGINIGGKKNIFKHHLVSISVSYDALIDFLKMTDGQFKKMSTQTSILTKQ